ncbi:hypothetical protein ACLH0B_11880, partial [Aeromonas salmonicida]|uniref:hypothetical protein n=1 Tax=Aeromonas salmonicida TaxID=645 RepID=UPI003D052949
MVITFLLWRDKYPASLNCMLAPSEDLLAPDGNHKVQAWNNKAADLNWLLTLAKQHKIYPVNNYS